MELHAQIACAMPRELARKGMTWQDRAVYTEAIYYGRENLTDGVIQRTTLGFWMPDMPSAERVRRLNTMRDKGALLDHPDGWQFPEHVWRKWGKMRAEVDAQREAEALRKADYRSRRRGAAEAAEDVPTGQPVTARIRADSREQPEPYPEPEPYPKPEPEPDPSVVSRQINSRQKHPTGQTDDDVAIAALEVLADQWTAQRSQPAKARQYRATIMANADDHLPVLRTLAQRTPGATATDIAHAYDAPPATRTSQPTGHNSTCECEGTGWIEADPADESRAATVVPCTAEQTSATIHQFPQASGS